MDGDSLGLAEECGGGRENKVLKIMINLDLQISICNGSIVETNLCAVLLHRLKKVNGTSDIVFIVAQRIYATLCNFDGCTEML